MICSFTFDSRHTTCHSRIAPWRRPPRTTSRTDAVRLIGLIPCAEFSTPAGNNRTEGTPQRSRATSRSSLNVGGHLYPPVMAHTRASIAEFQQGESHFVYAAYRHGAAGLHFLADGNAHAERAFTKSELMCPIPGCLTPDLTTVARRPPWRQHYRHLLTNSGHAPERQFHVEAKARIAEWVQAQHPDATVIIEQPTNSARERVADVMVTFREGERVAIEIQYSALTVEEWQTRHDSYQAQGIVDVWCFGHVGAQLRTVGEKLRLNDVHRAVARTGTAITWFNPVQLLIGYAIAPSRAQRTAAANPLAVSGDATMSVEPLSNFALTSKGIASTALRDSLEATLHHLRATERERSEAEAARQEQEAEQRREAAVEEHRIAPIIRRRESRTEEWLRSDAWQNEVESWGGTAPDWYGDHPGVETGIPHEMWQSLLFWKIVDPTVPPAAVYSFDAINLLLAEFPAELPPESRQVAAQMVVAFFTTLERHRYLDGPIKKSRKLGALSWYRTLADSAPSAEPSWNANPSLERLP